jgi:hypothetical protein
MNHRQHKHSSSHVFTIVFLFTLVFLCDSVLFAQQEKGIVLENDVIRVEFDTSRPSVMRYVLKKNNAILSGDLNRTSPAVSFYKGDDPVYRMRTKISFKPEYYDNKVVYHAEVNYENKPAISFDLLYQLKENELTVTLNNVVEEKDFYLLNINMPSLVSVRGGDGKLVIPADAGRLIDVNGASLKTYEYEIDWLNPILAAMAYDAHALAVVDTKSIENHSAVSISDWRGEKYGSVSMNFIYRLKEYDLPGFGTMIPAKDHRYFLKVQDSCTATVAIIGDYDNDGKVDWVDGSKLLRKEVNATPNPYYKDKTFVRTFLARKGGNNENLTFNQVLDRIKEFARQTDSAAYVMYLLGWQYTGHDSGYPSIDSVNNELGGYGALVNLINEARKYNVNVTFYDNYDDSYPTHPGWDPDVICMDPEGNLMRGGAWDGEQSYLISSYKYAVKSGLNRVKRTLDTYPVKDAYFIDVLAGGYRGGRKYDFNPSSPAGAIKNFEGKKMLIKAFNDRGLDVATEDFTGFFVGYSGTFGDIIAFDNIYFRGEEQIPLIPLIYHSKTSFGMKTSGESQYVKTFLYGQRAQVFTNLRLVYTPSDYILDALPKQILYGKTMKTYQKNGEDEQVIYEDGTTVSINVNADTYSVTMPNGEVIARNYTSFAPVSSNVRFACSKDSGEWEYKLPAAWTDQKKISVHRLETDGSEKNIPFTIKNGELRFNADAEIPYKIVYQ